VVTFRAEEIAPTVTWGINPGQAIPVDGRIPLLEELPEEERGVAEEALVYMGFRPGQSIKGVPVQVAFIGSCTNARLSDLREVVRHLKGHKVKKGIRALVVPGSEWVARKAEEEGIAEVFREAGFEWRMPGCSMRVGMNPDRLEEDELCASSSNRNYEGRMGSPRGRPSS
jgi:3-isopropylmalate/(R)-2-methylmalate dehydratase large subunit